MGAVVERTSKELADNGPAPQPRPQGAGSVLDFEPSNPDAGSGSDTGRAGGELDLEDILSSVRETAYRWDFKSDRIDWAPNAAAVLGIADFETIARGRAFALLVDPEQAGARYDGITGGPHVAPGTELRYSLQLPSSPRRPPQARRAVGRGHRNLPYRRDGRPSVAQGTLRAVNDRREREERLLYLGSHDELTGQLNRTKLTEALTRFLGSASRTPAKGAFLLAGVNDLTLINETYGYDVGDEVITIVGRRIGRALRGKDCIGRFSSNKFGIVLTDCSEEGVEAIARRLMATIRDSVIDTSVGAVAASISVGAVLLPDHAGNAQAAISRALQALDLVRGSRNDRLGLYEPCERRESERRRSVAIADEIVRALNDRRMILALQPIVTSRSHEPELYECLSRMRRLDGSIVSAGEFIPVAEQFGLAKLVDHRALESAVELLRSMPTIELALNVSAATATDPQWLQGLEAFIGKGQGWPSG
jgi:diguanylate cyclase (GGDEF)-like protein